MAPQKVVTKNVTYGALWTGSTFFFLLFFISELEAPTELFGATIALGTVLWITVSVVDVKKLLNAIERQETGNSHIKMRSNTEFLLLVLAVLAGGSGLIALMGYIVCYQPFWTFLIGLVVPVFSSFYFTSAVYCWRWQRRTKRTLYVEERRLYAQPAVGNTVNDGK
jgi:hypothetical protein